jgi:hypothetical protein
MYLCAGLKKNEDKSRSKYELKLLNWKYEYFWSVGVLRVYVCTKFLPSSHLSSAPCCWLDGYLLLTQWFNTVTPIILPIASKYVICIRLHKFDLEHFLHTVDVIYLSMIFSTGNETLQMGRTECKVWSGHKFMHKENRMSRIIVIVDTSISIVSCFGMFSSHPLLMYTTEHTRRNVVTSFLLWNFLFRHGSMSAGKQCPKWYLSADIISLLNSQTTECFLSKASSTYYKFM